MPSLKAAFVLTAILLILPACAPRALVAPISPDTPPEKVLAMARASEEGINGIRAYVNITVQEDGGEPRSFNGVLYVARPDRVRLTGLAMLGFTVFDVVLTGDKFYFYEHSLGYLYTGPRASLGGFLREMGVNVDPDIIYMSLFTWPLDNDGRYVYDKTRDGYAFYLVRDEDGLLIPRMKVEYDAALSLKRKIFYDGLAKPYLFVTAEGVIEQDGFRLPKTLRAEDMRGGYRLSVGVEKYVINPEGLDGDFTIQGGELKGIREID